MRTIVKEFKVYKYSEASEELKEKIRDYFARGITLYQHHMEERIATLEAFADRVDATLDYSLSCVPDRDEFIRLKPKTDEVETLKLVKEFADNDEYGSSMLTGVCYDDDLKDFIKSDGLFNGLLKYINDIHNEYESMLQDEYIAEYCDINDYEFTEDGELY